MFGVKVFRVGIVVVEVLVHTEPMAQPLRRFGQIPQTLVASPSGVGGHDVRIAAVVAVTLPDMLDNQEPIHVVGRHAVKPRLVVGKRCPPDVEDHAVRKILEKR